MKLNTRKKDIKEKMNKTKENRRRNLETLARDGKDSGRIDTDSEYK